MYDNFIIIKHLAMSIILQYYICGINHYIPILIGNFEIENQQNIEM